MHKRSLYLEQFLPKPPIEKYVTCPLCYKLYEYKDCIDRVGTQYVIKLCSKCLPKLSIRLLKKIVTTSGSIKYYPNVVYPYASLVSQLQTMFLRPGFLDSCERWRTTFTVSPTLLADVFDGSV